MPDIQVAYNFVIQKCNAPNVGYSMDTYLRRGNFQNGIQYYDCSSLMSAALTAGGFFTTNPWFSTHVMNTLLPSVGFTRVPIDGEWKAGDILWRTGHTEMVYQGRITMGAHSDSYPLAEQVSINDYASSPSAWTYCYRFGSGATPGNSYDVWMGWIPNESGYAYGTIEALSRMGDRGRAYGQYQFDYRYGLVPFMQYCVTNYSHFSGFAPYILMSAGNSALVNNNELHNLFVNYATNYTSDFLAAQNACAINDYLQPAIDYILRNYAYDIKEKGAVVLGSLFSMAIRSGYVTAAQKYSNCANMGAVDIINYTYDTYGSADAGRWLSGTPISQRDKALKALQTGNDIYDLNAGGGVQPEQPTNRKFKWIYYMKGSGRKWR